MIERLLQKTLLDRVRAGAGATELVTMICEPSGKSDEEIDEFFARFLAKFRAP